jgi:hypothetical protein
MPGTDRPSAARVQACRDEIAGQIRAYRDLVGAASKASGMSLTRIDAALAAFEPAFFNNLLIALDARFASTMQDVVGDAGNAQSEVRLLANSLTHHGGVLTADPALRREPESGVLRMDFGERIALNADDFEALCAAFLAEIDRTSPAA